MHRHVACVLSEYDRRLIQSKNKRNNVIDDLWLAGLIESNFVIIVITIQSSPLRVTVGFRQTATNHTRMSAGILLFLR